MNGWVNRYIRIDGWMHIDGWIVALIINRQMELLMAEWMDGLIDGSMDRRMNGWMEV